jgi:hypothetical protein
VPTKAMADPAWTAKSAHTLSWSDVSAAVGSRAQAKARIPVSRENIASLENIILREENEKAVFLREYGLNSLGINSKNTKMHAKL